jgi:hypothetical protein
MGERAPDLASADEAYLAARHGYFLNLRNPQMSDRMSDRVPAGDSIRWGGPDAALLARRQLRFKGRGALSFSPQGGRRETPLTHWCHAAMHKNAQILCGKTTWQNESERLEDALP